MRRCLEDVPTVEKLNGLVGLGVGELRGFDRQGEEDHVNVGVAVVTLEVDGHRVDGVVGSPVEDDLLSGVRVAS